MTSFSSRRFVSSCAHGVDWRQAAAQCLQELSDLRTPDDGVNFGFLYISDTLADEARTILHLFQEATGVEAWIGTVGIGVFGTDGSHFNEHAISAMIGRLPEDCFQILPGFSEKSLGVARELIAPWLSTHGAVLGMVHGDPGMGDPQTTLELLNEYCGAFPVGGMSASRGAQPQFCGTISTGAVSGALFDHQQPVLIGLTQSCAALGGPHMITGMDEFMITQLDGKPALEVMSAALQLAAPDDDDAPGAAGQKGGAAIGHPGMDMTGEVLAALPVKGSDTGDFLVRNIAGIDPQDGWIAVADDLKEGDEILFVQRQADTALRDMQTMLEKLKKRCGEKTPTGGVYISCAARANDMFPEERTELDMIRETFGDIPLTGFYASGEISGARLYTYSGVLTLFL